MRYRVLEGGAIACSTVFIWNWTAHPDLNLDGQLCQLLPLASESTASSAKQACLQRSSLLGGGIMPENIFNLDWGGDHPNRPVQELEKVYEGVLVKAQALANRDRLSEAISTLGGIPKNSRHYPLSQQLLEDWSQEVLRRATQHYQQANLGAAIKLLHTIPSSCHQYVRAKKLTIQWREQAQLLKRVMVARKSGNWNQVIQTLQLLEGQPLYQSSFVQQTLQYAMSKQFEPGTTLMQIASSTTQAAPSMAKRPRLAPQEASLSIKAIPQQKELEIATEQALEWAQPPRSNTIATQSTKPATSPLPNPVGSSPAPKPLFPYQLPNPTATKRDTPTTTQPQHKSEDGVPEIKPKTDDNSIIY